MSETIGQRVVLASRPQGLPRLADFRLEQWVLPEIGEGQILLAARHLSLDPYMRGRMDDRKSYSPATPIGGIMEGEVIARVERSRHPDYRVGEQVSGRLGWLTHAVSDGTGLVKLDRRFSPVTTALGVLGMPGLTAYAGLLEIGKPRPGETVVVGAATGPVGSLVGQIAKIKGARAVGVAGGQEKCAYVRGTLGFDAAIDRNSPTFAEDLAAACPDGVDIYFELVGGLVWQAVLPLLNEFARVPLCGRVAEYNGLGGTNESGHLSETMRELLARSIMLRGFIVREFRGRREAFLSDVGEWIDDGRVHFREQVSRGLASAPGAFIDMLAGRNFGKVLVAVEED